LRADVGSPPGGALIENTSDSACALPEGRPAVDLVWRGMSLHPKQEILRANFRPRVSILASHRKAVVWMQFAVTQRCDMLPNTAPVRPTLVVSFHSGLTVRARTPLTDWVGSSRCFSRSVVAVSPAVEPS
jgi:hypothetical protein